MEVKELIAEVAKEHHVLLDENDPIFVAVTVNRALLRAYLEEARLAGERAQAQAVLGAGLQVDVARKVAAELISKSAGYVDEQVRLAGKRLVGELGTVLKDHQEEVRKALLAAADARRASKRWSLVAVVSSVLAILAAGSVAARLIG